MKLSHLMLLKSPCPWEGCSWKWRQDVLALHSFYILHDKTNILLKSNWCMSILKREITASRLFVLTINTHTHLETHALLLPTSRLSSERGGGCYTRKAVAAVVCWKQLELFQLAEPFNNVKWTDGSQNGTVTYLTLQIAYAFMRRWSVDGPRYIFMTR